MPTPKLFLFPLQDRQKPKSQAPLGRFTAPKTKNCTFSPLECPKSKPKPTLLSPTSKSRFSKWSQTQFSSPGSAAPLRRPTSKNRPKNGQNPKNGPKMTETTRNGIHSFVPGHRLQNQSPRKISTTKSAPPG